MAESDAAGSEAQSEEASPDSPVKKKMLTLFHCSLGVNAARRLLEKRREKVKRQQRVLKRIMQLKLEETEPSINVSDSESDEDGSVEDEDQQYHDEKPPTPDTKDDDSQHEYGGEAELRRILQRRFRRRQKVLGGYAEQYTDSTRNAAVLMGEQDIKLSLWRRHRAAAKQAGLPSGGTAATATAATAAAQGLIRAGRPAAALSQLDQALELEPLSRRLLLARSDCHLLLGQPRLALLDAQEALDLRAPSADAQLRKAQAFYALGHFERALVLFHRGLKARPSCPAFRLGVQQAKEAIQDTMAGMNDALRLTEQVSFEDSLASEEMTPKRSKAAEDGASSDNSLAIVTTPEAAGDLLLRLGNAVGRFIGDPDSGPTWGSRRKYLPEDAGEPGHMCESCNTSHHLPPPPPPAFPRIRPHALPNKNTARPCKVPTSSTPQHSNTGRSEEGSKSGRPTDRRVPPALVNDLAFLEYVADLQDGHISALAGDALVFLQSRKLFWQRRGLAESLGERRTRRAPPALLKKR